MWRNYIKCKYMFMFPLNNLARKGILLIVLGYRSFTYSISFAQRNNVLAGTRYSRLLFSGEDRLCANLHVQEQSTNMTWQCQYLAFAWLNYGGVTMPSQQRHISWLSGGWCSMESPVKIIVASHHSWQKLSIHFNPCIILYILNRFHITTKLDRTRTVCVLLRN